MASYILKLYRSLTDPQIVNVLPMHTQKEAKVRATAAHQTRIKVWDT